MSNYTTTMTQRSQVTVPSKNRRVLGLRTGDRIVFTVSDGVVSITPAQSIVESLSGSIRMKSSAALDFGDAIEDAAFHRGDEIVAKLGRE